MYHGYYENFLYLAVDEDWTMGRGLSKLSYL
jgi:hypothetical protein